MFRVFIYVLAGNAIGSAVYLTLFARDARLDYMFLWQIIAIAAACAITKVIFWSRKELSKGQIIVRYVIHFLCDGLVVVGGAFLFHWIGPTQIKYVILIVIFFTATYIYITKAMIESDKRVANALNKKLREYNSGEEEV
jgi:uncharacterized membrane protein YfcA